MKNINKYLKSSLVLAAFVYSVGTTIPMQSTYADEINTELVNNETIKEWKPEGNIIAQGEDGVPWELYENGYLLFTPVDGKDTLGITNSDGTMNGLKFSTSTTESLQEFKNKIKVISFSGKTYLPSWPNMNFFALFKNLEFFDGENLDLSKTDSLYTLFLGDEKLNNIKLENWDVSHIRTFRGMFADTAIKKLDLSKWNFSEAPNSTKEDLFGGAESLEEITLPESFFNLTERDKKHFENNISIWSITGLHSNPQKTNIHNGKWVRKEDKKEINDFTELKMNDKSNAGTWTRKYNKIQFIDYDSNLPANIVEFSNKFTDESILLPEPPNKVVRDEETGDYYIFNSWIVEVPREEDPVFFEKIPVKTISDVKELYKTRFKNLDNGKNDEYSTYIVRPQYEKIISINTPLISNPNGNDEPELNINNKTEYKEDVSTNTPIDENGNLIAPPTVEKPEYTGPVSTNTPVDDNGNLILPPVLDKPEFNRGVNSIEPPVEEKPEYKSTLSTNTPIDENENLILPPVEEKPKYNGSVNSTEPPVENKPEYKEPVSTNTPVDDNGNLIAPPTVEKPEYKTDSTVQSENETTKEETKLEKERELPNTNSTSILTTLVSSVIGTLSLGYKSKRRK